MRKRAPLTWVMNVTNRPEGRVVLKSKEIVRGEGDVVLLTDVSRND